VLIFRSRTPPDMESTTGSWDVYGVQETKRYPEARRW